MDYVKLEVIISNIRNEFEACFLSESELGPAEMLAKARKTGQICNSISQFIIIFTDEIIIYSCSTLLSRSFIHNG